MQHHAALHLSSLHFVLTNSSPVYALQFSSTSYDCISCKIKTTQQLPNCNAASTNFPFLCFRVRKQLSHLCLYGLRQCWPYHTPSPYVSKALAPNKLQETGPDPRVRTRASSRSAFPQVAWLILTEKSEKNEHSCWPCPGCARGIKADYIPRIKATHPVV